MSSILDTVENFVGPYISQLFTLLTGFDLWIQALIILAIAIFAIVGVFVFLKKFIKLFVVIAILGGIFYVVWTQTDIIQNLIGYTQFFGTHMSIF
ncbi:MAG: hypothetical protein KKE16_05930 [Firmicutes bacterium]|nr:hypothetical protein [Bacillota bacterium]